MTTRFTRWQHIKGVLAWLLIDQIDQVLQPDGTPTFRLNGVKPYGDHDVEEHETGTRTEVRYDD